MAEKKPRPSQSRAMAHIDPETEAKLEEAYGPEVEPPVKVEAVIGREQKERLDEQSAEAE